MLRGRPAATVPMAACVDRIKFRTWSTLQQWGHDPWSEPAWVAALSGMRVLAIASQPDGRTPLEMDTLGIRAGKAGLEVSKQVCRDCLELATGKLPLGTDSLRAEARLLTAGAAAVTGVLWVAVLLG